jgi:hypothetical protein
MLMCFDDSKSVCMKKKSIMPMEYMNAGRPCIMQKPANEDAIIAAVE